MNNCSDNRLLGKSKKSDKASIACYQSRKDKTRQMNLWKKMEKNGRNVSLSNIDGAKGLFANLQILK